MIPIEIILEDFGEQLIKDLRAALLKEGVGTIWAHKREPGVRLTIGRCGWAISGTERRSSSGTKKPSMIPLILP